VPANSKKKEKNIFRVLTVLSWFIALPAAAEGAAQQFNDANHIEQDKERSRALKPVSKSVDSTFSYSQEAPLIFPSEQPCWHLKQVAVNVEDNAFRPAFLDNLTRQAEGECIGAQGIQYLGKHLQNEIINKGYLTSYITIPDQDLRTGKLIYEVKAGRVGNIFLSPQSDGYFTLANNLPLKKNEVVNLKDLEQGAENLQRIPGSRATLQLYPGSEPGLSDIVITRHQDRYWKVGAWADDAGSRRSGRYQAGGAAYLYNPCTLNDIFFVSAGRDLAFSHAFGSQNAAVGYSIPWGYWSLDLYASRSRYRQALVGSWGALPFISLYRHTSAELGRVLSHSRTQKTRASLKIFKGTSRHFLDDIEVGVMHKQSPAWKVSFTHQHYFDRAALDATVSYQDRLGWLASSETAEEQSKQISRRARVLNVDIQGLAKFELTGPRFSYAPRLNVQYSPDELTQQHRFSIGNRWTVRGFDGENSLSDNSGWFLTNEFIWELPAAAHRVYSGMDVGKIIGKSVAYNKSVIAGGVMGIKGSRWGSSYDFFIGTPFIKPKNFTTDSVNMGFSLQWGF
jgi:hemolysin activation/secretion protein